MAKDKVQCFFNKDAEDIYVIETRAMGLRTDCYVADAFIKRNDEDGAEWSVSYDYLEYAIQYENAEDAKEAANNIAKANPSDDIAVISLALAKRNDEYIRNSVTDSVTNTNSPMEKKEDEEDVVNHPSHYETGKFECIEVMEEIYGREDVKAFCRCNAFKYLYRCKHKNGNQDIDKARWYINKYLDLCKEDGDDPDYPSLLHDVLDAYKKYDEEKTTKEVEE